MDFEQFNVMIDRIIAQGYTEDDAALFASLIGDTPQVDDGGRWLVIGSDGRILARLESLDEGD